MNQMDKRNLSIGLNAAVWPYLLFSPLGLRAGITASGICVVLIALAIFIHDHRRFVGCDLYSHMLILLPGPVYWTLAIVLDHIFG